MSRIMKKNVEDIANEWIELWSGETIPSVSCNSDGSPLDWSLPREDPELCLDSIIAVLEMIPAKPEDRCFQVLAAGPLEDLLVENGEKVLERVDELARQSPPFRLLLNGTWIGSASTIVQERLQKYRGKPW